MKTLRGKNLDSKVVAKFFLFNFATHIAHEIPKKKFQSSLFFYYFAQMHFDVFYLDSSRKKPKAESIGLHNKINAKNELICVTYYVQKLSKFFLQFFLYTLISLFWSNKTNLFDFYFCFYLQTKCSPRIFGWSRLFVGIFISCALPKCSNYSNSTQVCSNHKGTISCASFHFQYCSRVKS